MIFNASAGTGKTWQVTELYTALVLGRPHEKLPANRPPVTPRRILLMTFTDNAAAELRGKVSDKMMEAEKVAVEAGDDELGDRARGVLRSLPAAHISTIHAFCAGLLREHALEMGLSPSFQTLEDEERDTLLNDALKTEIFHCLERDPAFRDFCTGLSVLGDWDTSLIHTIRSLLEKADGRGLDLSRADALLPSPKQTVYKHDFERIHDELLSHDLPKTAAKALDALKAALDDFPNTELIAQIPKFGQARKVKHLSDDLADLKERFLTEALYEQNIGKFRAFARCLAGAATAFNAAKRARDAVDFGDQLLLTRKLLQDRDFSTLFDWIIVDEVQDTSRIQCEVVKALWGPQAHLVICGDKKQSIYAWRSADPDVMPDLEKEMDARGDFQSIPLKHSRRSKDRVIDAVNELFSGIYADYDSAALEPVQKIGAVTEGEKPCVEFLMPDSDADGVEEEMAAVARRIRLLTGGDEAWCPAFGYNGEAFVAGEPVRYGDILILLKRSTHLAVLEKALRSAGIPYTSGGKGRALFEQQEVRDLLLFLQVVTQPFNDLALVGFLRSPFAGVPDDEIVALGWDGETFDHEILRTRFFESGHEAAERILRFREQVGVKLPSQLVREMVRETGFDACWAGQPVGEQHLANFKKALDWLRAAERGGQVLAGDVVRRFEKAIHTPPRSGAAEALLPDPEQNAVTLMTVHGAKGLTRRVCFVPDISFGGKTSEGFALFSKDDTLEMKISGLAGEEVKSPGWAAARDADKAVRTCELDNVFYVAMTRARDLVVLSGAGTKKPNGWLKQAAGFLEGASPDILKKRSFAAVPEMEAERPELRDRVSEIRYVPLSVSAGMERQSVSSLCKKKIPIRSRKSETSNSPLYGTLGHAVLEELATSRWIGDIPKWVEQCCEEMGSVAETGPLVEQIEMACALLREETVGAEALFAEQPFVLRRDDVILDGTIDLLAKQSSKQWKIYDYKFSNESPTAALETYSPQLNAYREAVEKLNPGAEVSAALILIGETAQIISLPV